MNESTKEQYNRKKTSRRNYIIGTAILISVITVFSFWMLVWSPKYDSQSDLIIRQEVAKQLKKDQNNLTDEDFAGIKEFEVGTIVNSYDAAAVYKELSDIKLLEKFTGLQELHLSIHFPQDNIPKWAKVLAKWNIVDLTKRYSIELTPLEKINSIERLYLYRSQIRNLKPLSKLVNLRYLSISDTLVSDLEPLRNLSKLQYLDVWGTKVSNLKPLEGLIELKELWLSGPLISDLKPLKNLTNLKKLHLNMTNCSNLEPLIGLKKLRSLYIIDCNNISDEQIEDFKKALLNLKVERQM